MDTLLTSMAVGGLIGTGVSVALLISRKRCPNCKMRLRIFRKPSSVREAILGGWTCQCCGSKVARDGNLAKGSRR
jgi:hypothetical protein